MKFNWLDLVLALGALVAIIRGYRAGFLKSIFAIFGFVGGGLIGLIVGLHYLNNLRNDRKIWPFTSCDLSRIKYR